MVSRRKSRWKTSKKFGLAFEGNSAAFAKVDGKQISQNERRRNAESPESTVGYSQSLLMSFRRYRGKSQNKCLENNRKELVAAEVRSDVRWEANWQRHVQ